MKYYWCFLPLALCVPHCWGADAGRVPYHVETVAGSSGIGDGGPPLAAQFSNIQGIACDRLGNLYLSDTDNHRVRKVSGGVIATIAGTGIAGFSGDGGSALNAQLNLPYGLALDSAGNVYVADLGNQRVRRITPDGIITTVAGTGRKASSPDGAAPTDTSLLSPRNVAIDAAGDLYIAEFEGHRIRKLTPDGKLSTVVGTGVAGSSGDGNRASAAQIDYPAGMAFDRAGALYFADSGNNLVRKLYADGTIGTVLGRNPGTTLFSPLAVAMDLAGTLYVGDSTFVVARLHHRRQVDRLRRQRRPQLLRRRRSRRQCRAHFRQRPRRRPQRQPLHRRRRPLAPGRSLGHHRHHSRRRLRPFCRRWRPRHLRPALPALGPHPGFRRQPLHRRQRHPARSPGAARWHHDHPRRHRHRGARRSRWIPGRQRRPQHPHGCRHGFLG